ncbi:hypothetical protein [Draconibacterium mangrovi]|uniref:hypothetical protein n=1 Tax=Draconibacterium mangrovi TaxID=2697469 RepID=UPI0013D5F5F7|nr:hypothetical protein [Draconibacterium mangrovi]
MEQDTVPSYSATRFISQFVSNQSIPVELLLENKYGSVDITFTKYFAHKLRIGVFHFNSLEFDYDEVYKNSIILKDLLFVETVENLKLAAGAIRAEKFILTF